jgi:dienelactone hydrolase
MLRRSFVAMAIVIFMLNVVSLRAQTGLGTNSSHVGEAAKPTASKTPLVTTQDEVAFKEDWTTLSLAKSGLPDEYAGGIVQTQGTEPGECTMESMRVQWRPSDPIDLYVIRPIGLSHPAVSILLLNYTFDSAVFRDRYWCGQAKQNHLAIVGFGSAFSPQRFHSPRPMRQWFVSEFQEALSTSVHDVEMVLNYLDKKKEFDMKRVGIYGQGSGGAVAILSAAADPRITAIDVTDPWGDWPDWIKGSKQIPEMERAGYLKPEFLQKISGMDPVEYLPKLTVTSLRVQQVMNDPVTPQDAKEKIAAAAPDKRDVVRYADKQAQHKAVSLDGITWWLSQRLNTPSPVTAQK